MRVSSDTSNSSRVPILAYHWLVREGNAAQHRFEIASSALETQMAFLKRWGFRFLSPDRLPEALVAPAPLPERTACITFDDGTEDFYSIGGPLLSRLGIPAAVFIVASRIGGMYAWDENRGVRARPMLGWAQVRELAEIGFVIGSHTLTHPDLTGLDYPEAKREIGDSKRLIEDKLGRPVTLLAYPYGRSCPETRRMAADAGYEAAFGIQDGLGRIGPSQLFDLKRALVKGSDSRLVFAIRLLCALVRHEAGPSSREQERNARQAD